MLTQVDIWRLYENVLYNYLEENEISEADIRDGIRTMAKAYSPECTTFDSASPELPNYNHPAFRWAYLHKYARLHTYVVQEVMLQILRQKRFLLEELVSHDFKLCSIGGGPGSDVIGVLAALYDTFNIFPMSASVIDLMSEWQSTFMSIVEELADGDYGEMWDNLFNYFDWNYVGADLLQNMTNEVNKAIATSTLVTMVKFVSAVSCTYAEQMLEKIFRVMKPGAFVLFIDNAAGGFTQVFERASKKNCFKAVMPPLRHVVYENEHLKSDKFGYTSCFKTTVTIILLKKPLIMELNVNKLNIGIDNLNLNAKKLFDNSFKSRVKDDKLNLLNQPSCHSSCSYDFAIVENNINHLNQQRMSLNRPEKRMAPTPPQFNSSIPPTRKNYMNSRTREANRVDQRRGDSGFQRGRSYPNQQNEAYRVDQRRGDSGFQRGRSYPNQQNDDDYEEEEVDCSCCVIS